MKGRAVRWIAKVLLVKGAGDLPSASGKRCRRRKKKAACGKTALLLTGERPRIGSARGQDYAGFEAVWKAKNSSILGC